MRKRTDTDIDHIWPRAERGPDEDWNKRRVSARKNRSKGARMPNLSEVADSPKPIELAAKIDKHTMTNRLRHRRNRNRGLGGFPRLRP